MNIVLKKLNLVMFKGIRKLLIDFGQVTNIFGDNGLGKSSIVDAATYLLFGKDSQGNTNFDIKTLDGDGKAIKMIDHIVEGTLEVDGIDIKLSKTYREVWSKKRGEATKSFKGHETIYCLDDIPVTAKEYKDKVDSICNEDTFKLITNPLVFPNLHWTKQREILFQIIGNIDDENVINYNEKLEPLKAVLEEGKGVDHFIKTTKIKINKLKKEIDTIPVRVDECNNSIVEADYTALENQRNQIKDQIIKLEEQLEDTNKKNQVVLDKQQELFNLKSEYQRQKMQAQSKSMEPKFKLEKEIQNLTYKIQGLAFDIESRVKKIETLKVNIDDWKKQKETLYKEFDTVNAEVLKIDSSNFICPTCKREFETIDIEAKRTEMQENFNQLKSKKLEAIRNKGKGLNSLIDESEKSIMTLDIQICNIESDIEVYETNLKSLNKDYESFIPSEVVFLGEDETKANIKALEEEIQAMNKEDNSKIKADKMSLQADLEQVNKILTSKDNNEAMLARIEELTEKEQELSVIIARLEGQLFLADEFTKTKVELLEGKINEIFHNVNFKLFETQVNGGIAETCKVTVNGVPYTSVNNTGKINAGLDIINTLCNHYKVYAPIFVDNAESFNELVKTKSQLIRLVVSRDSKLRVEV